MRGVSHAGFKQKLVKPRELNMHSYFPVSVQEKKKCNVERMCMLKETMMACDAAAAAVLSTCFTKQECDLKFMTRKLNIKHSASRNSVLCSDFSISDGTLMTVSYQDS